MARVLQGYFKGCNKKVKGKGNLFYVKNTGSGCPSLLSQGLMIEVFDIHVKRKKKKKRFKNYI